MVSRLLVLGKHCLTPVGARVRLPQPAARCVHAASKQFAENKQSQPRVPERGQPIDTSVCEADEARKLYETSAATRRLNRYMFEQVDTNLAKFPGYHINTGDYDIIRKDKKNGLVDQPTWFDQYDKKKSE